MSQSNSPAARAAMGTDNATPLLLGLVAGKVVVVAPASHGTTISPVRAVLDDAAVVECRPVQGSTPRFAFNLLQESRLAAAELPWVLPDPESGVAGKDRAEQWTLAGGHTAFIGQLAHHPNAPLQLRYREPDGTTRLPVAGGARYVVSGLFGLHRCSGQILVELFGPAGEVLDRITVDVNERMPGGRKRADYARAEQAFVAPGAAVAAELSLIKLPTSTGSDSFLFFTDVELRFEPDDATPFDADVLNARQLAELRRMHATPLQLLTGTLSPRGHTHAHLASLSATFGPDQQPCLGSPLAVRDISRPIGSIDAIKSLQLLGSVSANLAATGSLNLHVYVDDHLAATTEAKGKRSLSRLALRAELPVAFFDGRPHLISLLTEDGHVVAERAEVLPFHLTPWSALERYASQPLPAALSPLASHRYVSLQRSFAQLAHTASDTLAGRVDQLHRLHDLLVEGHDGRTRDVALHFPMVEAPRVSIIIPVHNKWRVTRHCLASLLVAANQAPFEVILVDDGSSDETPEMAQQVANITYLRNERAEGFVRACNRGAEHARGDFVFFLNNDTEVTSGAVDELLYAFDNFEDIGLAGSKLLYPDGRLQEAGGIVWGTGDPWNYGRLGNPQDPRYCYLRQADYVSGAAIMLPSSLWRTLGGFSEEFAPAYFEDTDLAFKVRAAGMRVLYVPQSQVFHFEGISSGTDVASGMKRFQEVNRPKFKRKWRQAFVGGKDIGQAVDLEKDRGQQYRALVIDAQTLRPNNDAGSYAGIQEIRLLQSLGCKVTFIPENLSYMGADTERLQRMGVEVVHSPFALTVEEALERRSGEFDLIYITRYYIAAKLISACRRWMPQAKLLFCNADLHFLRQMREAMHAGDDDLLSQARETAEAELEVCRQVDLVLSYSDAEHAALEAHAIPGSKIALCPWVVETRDRVPSFAERSGVAFLGGFGHGPNALAVRYFVDNVLPALRRRVPDLTLHVFGSGSHDALRNIDVPGVIVEGYVDDVAEAYERCRVFVAPLMTGAGLKGKVIGALAHGLPPVLSPIAAEATGIRDGMEGYIVNTPEQWVERVAELVTSEAQWQAMSEAGLHLARQRFGFDRGRRQMAQALEAVGLYCDDTRQSLVSRALIPR